MKNETDSKLEELVRRANEGDRAALDAVVCALQDDVYKLALRMLGLRADAQDATQEILVKVVTHLSEFRGDSGVRTWVWRIAVRHVLRFRKTRREEAASFDTIEMLIAKGDANPPMPHLSDGELALLVEEVRLSCTQAMLLSLDRDHRVAWILAEIFGLDGEEAAAVVEIEPAAYRKRLSRARERLATWMSKRCGLVDASNACRCVRQVPVAMAFGVASLENPEYAGHPARPHSLPILREADQIETAASALRSHPDYAAPPEILARIRALIAQFEAARFRMFD